MAVRRGPIIALAALLAVVGVGVALWRSIQGMQAQGHIAQLHALPGGQEAIVTLEYTGRDSKMGYVARVGQGGTRWYAHLPAPPSEAAAAASLVADEELVVVRSVEPAGEGWRHHLSAYDAFDGEPLWTSHRELTDRALTVPARLLRVEGQVLELTVAEGGLQVLDVQGGESQTLGTGLGLRSLDEACLRGASLSVLRDDELVTLQLEDGTVSRLPLSRKVQGGRHPTDCGWFGDDLIFTLPGEPPGIDTRFVRASPEGKVAYSVAVDGRGRWLGPFAQMTPIWLAVEDQPGARRLVMFDAEHGEPAWTGAIVQTGTEGGRVETTVLGGQAALALPGDDRVALFDAERGNLIGGQRLPEAGPLRPEHVGGSSFWRFTTRDHGFGELPWVRLEVEHLGVLEQGHPETVTQDVTMEMADELGVPDERIGGR